MIYPVGHGAEKEGVPASSHTCCRRFQMLCAKVTPVSGVVQKEFDEV